MAMIDTERYAQELSKLRETVEKAADALHLPQMLGCISGNDSVALIARSESDACSLCRELEKYCK